MTNHEFRPDVPSPMTSSDQPPEEPKHQDGAFLPSWQIHDFLGKPEEVAAARRWLRQEVFGSDHPLVYEAAELMSEAANNAVLHTASKNGKFTVTASVTATWTRISVADQGSTGTPAIRHDAEEFAEDGRGLRIIDTLAAKWGIERENGCTTVYFELRIEQSAPVAQETTADRL